MRLVTFAELVAEAKSSNARPAPKSGIGNVLTEITVSWGRSVPSRTDASRCMSEGDEDEFSAAQKVRTADVTSRLPSFETFTVAMTVSPALAWLLSSDIDLTRRLAVSR